MIADPDTGTTWGTATEIAQALGLPPASGYELVRSWARRGLIARRNIPGRGRGTTLYPLAEAEEEERRSRRAARGRPRHA